MILTSPTKSNIEVWLGQERLAKGGGVFTPEDNIWRLDPTAGLANIEVAKKAVNNEEQPWLVAALAYYAKERSARTLNAIVRILKKCAASKFNILDEDDALAIRNSTSKSEFSSLRVFLKQWREEYLLAVCPSERVVAAVYALKPNNISGPCPVESMDPVKGPFSLLETQAIFEWVNDAYTYGRISTEKFLYIRLLIATGARKSQMQKLVFEDVYYSDNEPVIRMPKSKERGFEYRGMFKSYKLASDLYDLIVSYKKITLQRLEDERPGVDWKKALPNVPIFRAKGKGKKDIIVNAFDLSSLELAPQKKFHKSDGSMSALLYKFKNDPMFPISERTGKPINLGSHRFRHTLGTDLARMGFGPYVIASALGHDGIHSVGRYIKTSPDMGRRLDDKMKKELALVVNAFQGRIVENENDAINGSLSNKTVRGPSAAIATCGATGNCHLDAPVACYTCSKFQPWAEGPHKEVLERLRLRQKRAIEAAGKHSDAAISFDRPILAVMQVINKIEIKKMQAEGGLDE
ncbi:MAG: site-specific integrase [Halomonas sp.]|nr:site-specific integrase [Halomonas sp.]MDN6297920.1 site-specific integrase [Halomonas sp.]MDN6315252.1 site-specific integrase [Halomonas sp.]